MAASTHRLAALQGQRDGVPRLMPEEAFGFVRAGVNWQAIYGGENIAFLMPAAAEDLPGVSKANAVVSICGMAG